MPPETKSIPADAIIWIGDQDLSRDDVVARECFNAARAVGTRFAEQRGGQIVAEIVAGVVGYVCWYTWVIESAAVCSWVSNTRSGTS